MLDNDVIVYRLGELENCSRKLGRVAEALENVKKIAKNSESTVNECWQGESYEAFAKRLSELNGAIETLYTQVSGNKNKLDKAIALERQNEDNLLNNTVGRLSAENIF